MLFDSFTYSIDNMKIDNMKNAFDVGKLLFPYAKKAYPLPHT